MVEVETQNGRDTGNSPSPFADFDPPEPPTDLIFDDGEPLESNRHRIAMNVLIDSLLQAFQDRTDFFVGGNMFVYYSREQAMNRDFRGPDFFVALDVDSDRERKGWVSWEEGGRYPDVIVELMSPSTARQDKTVKKDLYEKTFHTLDYYIYDPFDPDSLQGWHLNSHRQYEPIEPNERGWLWCETLGLWLGTWEGSLRREPPSGTCHWLRFYDPDGNLVLIQDEVAEQERQQAEQERQRAEQERQRAEQEQQRAEQERQRAERLAARLRELGEDPEEM
ncbi:MAG: Uma2 family endonuclease [Leptolyngbyaceae cyanobacterium RM1_405_57]|nr:Uma2 family endonuclease [Leptolyngbyaceae cyanobacterium RM1_405_57]